MSVESLPLFPLRAVLVPGAAIGLRVYERRYLDLVRECGRAGRGFGVCLILDGREFDGRELDGRELDEGEPGGPEPGVQECGAQEHGAQEHGAQESAPTPAAFGTEAVIEDFGTGDDGLLTLRVRGRRRFHAERTRVRDNGLVVAEVRWCDPDPDDELQPQHALLATLLQRILEQVGGEHANAAQACFDDAAWVGWRLAELLPLEHLQRQALLQQDDPHARLDSLLALLP